MRTGEPAKLARANGFPWDPGIWTAATRGAGGMIDAALDAWQNQSFTGSLSSGLHHARRTKGSAFCTFNALAVAAYAALDAGARRVLILDFDAHGGGGTRDIVQDEPRILHLDIAIDKFDSYSPRPPSIYQCVGVADRYLPLIKLRLERITEHGPIDLCLYNAGVDSHAEAPGGGLTGITTELLRQREDLVFRWAQAHAIPTTFVLAGGYVRDEHDRATLVSLHRQTITSAVC